MLLASAAPSRAAEGASGNGPLLSRGITSDAGLEGRVVWIDGYANLDVLATRAGIAGLMEKMRRAHINTVVFGAKMFGGQALYASDIAPRLTEWRGQRVSPDLDMLRAVVEEAHARGLKVHAALVEGEFLDEKAVQGLARMPSRRDLQARVVAILCSPGANLAALLLSGGGNIAGCLKSLVEKLEKAETPAA